MDVFAPAFLRMARDIAAHLGRQCKGRDKKNPDNGKNQSGKVCEKMVESM
jgi:hypothetical protein